MNIDRDDEYATRYEAAPTIEEQIAHERDAFELHAQIHGEAEPMMAAKIASLERLKRLDSQPGTVEPELVALMRRYPLGDNDVAAIDYIDSLQSALQRAQENVKKWQSLAEENIKLNTVIQKRAEQAEKDRDACYASLEATRSKLHEITAFVNDNASPQRESEQERDAFARTIDKLTAGCGQVNHYEFKEPCFWIQDSDGVWNSSCEHSFEFNDGGPDENGAKFCMYCGLPMAAQSYEEEK